MKLPLFWANAVWNSPNAESMRYLTPLSLSQYEEISLMLSQHAMIKL